MICTISITTYMFCCVKFVVCFFFKVNSLANSPLLMSGSRPKETKWICEGIITNHKQNKDPLSAMHCSLGFLKIHQKRKKFNSYNITVINVLFTQYCKNTSKGSCKCLYSKFRNTSTSYTGLFLTYLYNWKHTVKMCKLKKNFCPFKIYRLETYGDIFVTSFLNNSLSILLIWLLLLLLFRNLKSMAYTQILTMEINAPIYLPLYFISHIIPHIHLQSRNINSHNLSFTSLLIKSDVLSLFHLRQVNA